VVGQKKELFQRILSKKMPLATLYDVRTHKIVKDVNLNYPVLRSLERSLRYEVEASLFSLFDWPSVIVNLISSYLVGEVPDDNNSAVGKGLSFGRNTGESDLLRLSLVNRYFYRALLAHPIWNKCSLSLFASNTLGRYRKAFYIRNISRFIHGARQAYILLDLFTFKGCGARSTSPCGVDTLSLQLAQEKLGCLFPPSFIASILLRHPKTVPFSPQQGAWGDFGDESELEGSGGMAILPLISPDEFDGWIGSCVEMTISMRKSGSAPRVYSSNDGREKVMIMIAVTRTFPCGPTLWIDCGNGKGTDMEDEIGGVYDCRPLSIRKVAKNFVEYLFHLTE